MFSISYTDKYNLKGKSAIITGGAGIIGQHFCKGMAQAGANVAVVDLNYDAAVNLANELYQTYGVHTKGISCDITNPADVSKMTQEVVGEFGQINILHNNAAGKSNDLNAFFAPFEEYSLDQWRKIMEVNIDGMFLVAQAVGKQMVKQNSGGSIIQTSSIYGIMGPDHRIYEGSFYLDRQINTPAVYSASKAAVIGLTKYLATYWANKGIRVNTISPGGIESGQNEEFSKRYSARIPMGRMAHAEEMVGALLYLSSEASSYVTGQNIVIDGGLSAW